MPLQRRREAFDHPDWLFELKYDGFRALAMIQPDRAQLISRNGHPFASYADLASAIATDLNVTGSTVLDGEIVCLDRRGRPQFKDLLFRRGQPCYFTFDLLMLDGKDQCNERLIDRKQELRRLLTRVPTTSCAEIRRLRGQLRYSTLSAHLQNGPRRSCRKAQTCSLRRQP